MKRNKRIDYICLISPHYVISNVSSNRLSEQMHIRISCVYSTFLHCACSNVSSNLLPQKRNSHICCICLISPHYVFSNVSSNRLSERMHSHSGCICLTFSTVHFQMSPQIAFLNRCIVTVIAFLDALASLAFKLSLSE